MPMVLEVEKFKVNLNTIIAGFGLLSSFAILVTMWNDQINAQENTDHYIGQHNQLHEALAKDLALLHGVDAARDSQVLDLTFRIAQLEKGHEALGDRLTRIAESYSTQFSDIRTTLSAITTQLALTNQSLQRLEAAGNLPPPPTNRRP